MIRAACVFVLIELSTLGPVLAEELEVPTVTVEACPPANLEIKRLREKVAKLEESLRLRNGELLVARGQARTCARTAKP